jgi:chitodextrinase
MRPTPRKRLPGFPLLAALALAVAGSAPALAAQYGSGSVRDALPANNPADAGWAVPSQITSYGPGGVPNYAPATPRFKPGVPAISNKWWSGLGWTYWGMQSSGLNSVPNYALPLAFMAVPGGAGVWQADQPSILRINGGATDWMAGTPIDGMEFLNNGYPNAQHFNFYDQDLIAGLEGLVSGDPLVASYSDWAVTAEWSGGAGTLQVTSASGSPYMFFKRSAGGANARVEVTGGLTVFYNAGNVLGISVSKAAANYRPGTLHHYLLVAPSGVNWGQSGSVFSAPLGGKGYFTVAALPDNSAATASDYAQYAHNHITNTQLSWSYNEASATLSSTYSFSTVNQDTGATNQPTLAAVFPHTWKGNLNNPANTAYAYASPRGQMKVVRGTSYTSSMRFNGLLPVMPVASADVAKLNGYINDIAGNAGKIWQTPPEGTIDDAYWSGRAVARVASLVSIAAQTGNTAARDSLLTQLKARLQDWFTYTPGEANKHWAYDATWHTLCPIYDMHYACRDLSDHHFINGYFIRAAAIVAMFDPNGASWAQAWGPLVEQLIKDPMNWDRSDTKYAFLRHYSPVEGHSWASGIAFGNGLNEESSSEGMNFATGVALWGIASGSKTIRDLGLMYYANQSRAIEEYWFDVDQSNHPAEFKPQNVGIVWSNGGLYGTWWTPEPRAIHGINILPITSGSIYFGRRQDQIPRYLNSTNSYQAKYQGLPAPTPPGFKPLMGPMDWSDLFWSYQANNDAATAVGQFNANPNAPSEWGQTKADVYNFLSALATFGRLDTTVTANVPSYQVFNKGGVKSYAAFNPGTAALCVSFSDGRTMSVAAKQLAVNGPACSTGDTQAPSVPTGLAAGTRTTSSIALSWAASTDNVGVTGYLVLRNGAQVGTPSGTSYTDTGLAAGTTYSYSVKAKDAAGNVSGASATVNGTTSSGTVTVPARSTIQAESYSAADARITKTAGGTAVGTTLDGSWIKLSSIDFGSSSPVDFVMNLASGLNGSGAITLYRDSITPANQIATLGVGNTGGWTAWRQVAMNLSTPTTGVHDLYITFNTPYVDANGLVNLDWILFR